MYIVTFGKGGVGIKEPLPQNVEANIILKLRKLILVVARNACLHTYIFTFTVSFLLYFF